MPPTNEQLVQMIAQQVIDVLRERGMLSGAANVSSQVDASTASPTPHVEGAAPIHPPIGVCTGDYSQFPELRGKLYGQSKQPADASATTATSPASNPSADAGPLPLTGFVTANQLQDALAASKNGVVYLAADAKLTPLGNDLARQFPERVMRVTRAATQTTIQPGGGSALPWMYYMEGSCPVAREIVTDRRDRLRPVVAVSRAGALPQVIREIAQQIGAGQAAGGLLFVPSAALAMCYANRCSAIRAVLGTCGEAVEEGIRDLGANLLVIEYPHHGRRSQSAMVDRMLEQTPTAPSHVQRQLAEMHRC